MAKCHLQFAIFFFHIPSLTALLTTCLIALGLGLYDVAAGEGVYEMVPGKGSSYCEEIREHEAVRTPVNSWSNLVIATAGGWALGRAIEQHRQGVELPRVLLLICMGLSQLCLCVGSFFYHAVLNQWGHWLDVSGMYWVMNAALASSAWRWWECIRPENTCVRRVDIVCLCFSLCAADCYLGVATGLHLNTVFSSQFATVAVLEIMYSVYLRCSRTSIGYRIFLSILGLSLLGAALAFRQEGIKAKKANTSFCDPWSLFQPHAVWHVLCGFGLLVQNDIQMGPCSFLSEKGEDREKLRFNIADLCHYEQTKVHVIA